MALNMQRIRWPKWRQLTHPRNAKDCFIPHARMKQRKNWMKNETEQSKPKPKPETEPGFRSRSAPAMPCNSSHIRCQPGKLTQLFTQVSLSLSKLSPETEQMLCKNWVWCFVWAYGNASIPIPISDPFPYELQTYKKQNCVWLILISSHYDTEFEK